MSFDNINDRAARTWRTEDKRELIPRADTTQRNRRRGKSQGKDVDRSSKGRQKRRDWDCGCGAPGRLRRRNVGMLGGDAHARLGE